MEFTEYTGELIGLRKKFLIMKIDQSMINLINNDIDEGCYDFFNDEKILERCNEEEVLKIYYGVENYFKKFNITKEIFLKLREKYFGKSSQIVKFPFPAKIITDSVNDNLFFYSIDEEFEDLIGI